MTRVRPESAVDVAIVGGGLVGASLACALAHAGIRCAVFEAVAPRADAQPSYDDRTLALSASSCNILKALDLWPSLAANATPIRQVWAAEPGKPGRVELDAAELGLEEFGNVVEARVFGAAVFERLSQLGSVESFCPAKVTGVHSSDRSCHIDFEHGGGKGRCEASLIVGADGARSEVRLALGIGAQEHDYGTAAIICNFTPEQPHANRAFECFTPSGPLAVLPHVGGRCGLVWCVETEQLEAWLDADGDAFLAAAQACFEAAMGSALGAWSQPGRRSSYPLGLVRAQRDTAPRAVIMGNAAHAIHPIGAQGFNLGLRDAAVLAEVLAAADAAGEDIGSIEVLDRYSRWREDDHDGTIGWSDGLARLFSNPSPVAQAMRTAGLLAHVLVPAVRRRTAIRAMGFRGKIPRLAQGIPLERRSRAS